LRTTDPCGLTIVRDGSWLVGRVDTALDSKTRTKGLLGRDHLDPDRGLVIAPTQVVHTFGMKFSIDIVAVTREGRVVKCRTHVPPRRIVLSLRAFAIVELAAGAVARVGLREGDQLAIAPAVTGRLQD
jgi:uncharacterized membrane protein (UPF0127 family)